MDWKTLNLCVKAGTLFFVGGHKVSRLEHKSTFSLWPCSHPLIIISRNKAIYSYCFIRVLCGLTVGRAWKCPERSQLWVQVVPERGGISVSAWGHGWGCDSLPCCSLLFNSSLAGSSLFWLLPFSPAQPRDGKDNGIFTALLWLRWSEASCLGLFLQT